MRLVISTGADCSSTANPANGPADNWIRRWKISLASLPTDCDAAEITIEATESKNVWIGSTWNTTSNL